METLTHVGRETCLREIQGYVEFRRVVDAGADQASRKCKGKSLPGGLNGVGRLLGFVAPRGGRGTAFELHRRDIVAPYSEGDRFENMTMKISSACLVLALASAQAFAITRTLIPVRDNTLFEDLSPASARSNGAGTRIFAGRTNESTNSIRRALIAFDPSGAAIPNGASIVSAELTLEMNMSNAGPEAVSIHRVLANWGEADPSQVVARVEGRPRRLETRPGFILFSAALSGEFQAATFPRQRARLRL